MRLGLLTKRSRIDRAVWQQLPATAKIALLAKYGSRAPELVELGDLRGAS